MQLRILLTGGGTGGHVYPLIAVANALRRETAKREIDLELHYMGYVGEYRDAFGEAGIALHPIAAGKIRRYASLANLLDIPKFFISMLQAWVKLYFLMPDVIFSKGGTGAFPVILMGWFYRIPSVIHESDTVPGLNNAFSGRFAKRIAASFSSTLKYFNQKKGVHTGNPVREDIFINPPAQATAKQALGFEPDAPLILVLGGSQGSQRLNELTLLTLGSLVSETQVLHQTGKANYLDTNKLAQTALLEAPKPANRPVGFRYLAAPYFEAEQMKQALAAADLVVSRSGSNSIFEIAAFGKPAILIPLPESAGDHQRNNAYEYAEKGGSAIVIEEPNLLPDIFLAQIRSILGDQEKRAKMGEAARAFWNPGAADAIAEEILALA